MDKLASYPKKRFTVLDSFRGIFALCVVVFHAHYVNSITELPFFRRSDLFVDFFFVLSGFVITHGYAFDKSIQFGRFSVSRIFRLFPLHIAMLGFFILIEAAKLFAFKYGISFSHKPFTGETDPSQIVTNLLLLQSWTTYTAALSFNYPAWSISIEFYMYLIFYTTLLIKGFFRYGLWFCIASVATFLFVNNWLTADSVLSSSVLRGLSGFFSGAVTYFIYKKTSNETGLSGLTYSVLEIMLFIALLIIIPSSFSNKGVVLILLYSTSVYVFAHEKGVLSVLFTKKIFKTVGKLSYSIYMTHASLLLVILTIYMVFDKIFGMKSVSSSVNGLKYIDLGNSFANNVAIFLVLSLVILFSNLTYTYIELPGQALGHKFINKYLPKTKPVEN